MIKQIDLVSLMSSDSETWPHRIADFAEVYDISATLGEVAAYPGDQEYFREWTSRTENGTGCNVSALTLCAHAGTHLDAPFHLMKKGKTLDMYSLERFITPAQVVSAEEADSIQPSALQDLEIKNGEALLFKTDNSTRGLLGKRDFQEEYVYLSMEAAQLCIASGVCMVGIDYLSVDRYDDHPLPAHHCLLENDVLILEGIDLREVPPGRYLLICLPLRMKGNEASPVRAVLIR
jgi:arylformamidase